MRKGLLYIGTRGEFELSLYSFIPSKRSGSAFSVILESLKELNETIGEYAYDIGCVDYLNEITITTEYESIGKILDDIANSIDGFWFKYGKYIYIIPHKEVALKFMNHSEFSSAKPDMMSKDEYDRLTKGDWSKSE